MKRYKLKKDLPTFKAGDEFELDDGGTLWYWDCFSGIAAYSHWTIKKFPNILVDWFEEIPEKPKTVRDLEDGDECYYIDFGNAVANSAWRNESPYIKMRAVGSIFATREEAEKEIAWRKARAVLLQDTKGFKPDWNDLAQNKYRVLYDYDEKTLGGIFYTSYCTHRDLWFETEADVEESVKKHEIEWKIYLGVEE